MEKEGEMQSTFSKQFNTNISKFWILLNMLLQLITKEEKQIHNSIVLCIYKHLYLLIVVWEKKPLSPLYAEKYSNIFPTNFVIEIGNVAIKYHTTNFKF